MRMEDLELANELNGKIKDIQYDIVNLKSALDGDDDTIFHCRIVDDSMDFDKGITININIADVTALLFCMQNRQNILKSELEAL